MSKYTPLFSKIVDSSLWREPDYVVKIFITMIAKKDRDHVVRASAFNIGSWACKDESEVLEALKILSSPDTKRLEPQPFEGRRIEKVEDGWLILRGEYYQNLMYEMNRKRYKADWQQKKRNQKGEPPPQEPESPKRFSKPTVDDLIATGMSATEADKFLNYYDSVGWKVGKKTMVSWKGAAKGWMSRNGNFQQPAQPHEMTEEEIVRYAQG